MRSLASTIVALGTLLGSAATPALAGAVPGPSSVPSVSGAQVEKVHGWRHHHHGFGGFGLYVGPRWGGYYGGPYYGYSDPYWDDDYYDYPRTYYYPRYRQRNWGHRHRHWGHRRHRRH